MQIYKKLEIVDFDNRPEIRVVRLKLKIEQERGFLNRTIVITNRRQAVRSGEPLFKRFIPKQQSALIRQSEQAVYVSIAQMWL